jgi:hypothetical protein
VTVTEFSLFPATPRKLPYRKLRHFGLLLAGLPTLSFTDKMTCFCHSSVSSLRWACLGLIPGTIKLAKSVCRLRHFLRIRVRFASFLYTPIHSSSPRGSCFTWQWNHNVLRDEELGGERGRFSWHRRGFGSQPANQWELEVYEITDSLPTWARAKEKCSSGVQTTNLSESENSFLWEWQWFNDILSTGFIILRQINILEWLSDCSIF